MEESELWFSERNDELGYGLDLKIKAQLHEEQSPYQLIEVFETETFGNLLTLDGLVMLTDRDNFIYHEMMSHPVLFTHDNPRDVAIVGGGDCGVLKEVLKHAQVQQAIQVELDERVTRVTEEFFPDLCSSNNDPRASLLFTDAVKWVQQREAESLDIIIMDTTDPVGQATRLFSAEFYATCHRALRPGGLVVAQSESPLLHKHLITDLQSVMREAGFDDVQSMGFPQCTYPSGWWSATMAGKGRKLDNYREADVTKRAFATSYYNKGIHLGSRALPQFMLD